MARWSRRAREVAEALGDRPVAYRPALAALLGGVREALFVSQLLYWDGKGATPGGWIYKTQAEWRQETGLSRYEQETVRRHLRERRVLEEELRGLPARLYYRLDFETLEKLVGATEAGGTGSKGRARGRDRTPNRGATPAGAADQDAAAAQAGSRAGRDPACSEGARIVSQAGAGHHAAGPHAVSERTAEISSGNGAQADRSPDGTEPSLPRDPPSLAAVWGAAREELAMSMPRAAFARWIARCALASLDVARGEAVIEVPDTGVRDWLVGRLDPMVARTLSGVVDAPLRITYRVQDTSS
jgi:hypothetical protein